MRPRGTAFRLSSLNSNLQHKDDVMTFKASLALLVLACSQVCALSQEKGEEGFGIFSTREEYGQFMGMVKEDPALRPMVGMINDIVLGQPLGTTGQRHNLNAGNFGLLADPKIREALEMADFQFEEFQELSAEIHKQAAEQLRDIDFTDGQSAKSEIERIRDETETRLASLLLPHQKQRLTQINRQYQSRSRSLAEMLTSEPYVTDLEISEKQRQELLESEKEIEAELEKKIEQLRREARDELLSKLRRDQRDKVEEIFGPSILFNSPAKNRRTVRNK